MIGEELHEEKNQVLPEDLRFERRSRSDCVHEQVAKRIANVRFTLQKGHLKIQVPHCIIYLEDDRKRVPVALCD